ncbi:MAG: BrnT family toxin [Cyanobacteria bacterium]|nr:BrnT family toxin [Cyanobacteria bacterium CG_2015-16_32_12]NCO77934.1 BrnT family toxin [Cyanobacteria bacterium CG_2015-22_32_23]NCQ05514.1 BrnT family toxin [Cyanobacteria bacterium CG_2015-09_32_10]NCQ41511.1 BrnT family toxin [Cyanobacteria bacterium CG_2015-04_32_10]NCS83938.1 BrnT family toxin [Cyanobacteria bacterium CG_2015-02_32_10]
MKFEWDQQKAKLNLSKHGISFEEAQTVFDDPLYVDFYDPDHSKNEDRYIILGESSNSRVLLVSYTERGDKIRLISARQVTKQELIAYQER